MKKNRVLSLLLLLCILLCCLTPALAEQTADPYDPNFPAPKALTDAQFPADLSVDGKAAALIELNTGTLLFAQNIDQVLYPASLTKIMTCMLAIRYGNMDDVLTVSEEALADQKRFDLGCTLIAGEQLTLRELLYCTMVSSVNEACNVIAEHLGGSVETFVEMMNKQAAELGMQDTNYCNPHGLHDSRHVTTVRDLSTLARWAWQNEQFREFCTTTYHTVPATNLSGERNIKTTNYLTSTRVTDRYYYDKAEGLKTGFTTPAGGCLISTATQGNVNFMSIFCGGKTVANEDGSYTDMRFVESKRMLQYGVEHYSRVQVLSRLVMSGQMDVLYADGRSSVVVHPAADVSVLLPDSVDLTKIELRVQYDTERAEAPLAEGERVGTVSAVCGDLVLATADLVTLTAVRRDPSAGDKPAPSQSEVPSDSVEPTNAPSVPTEPTQDGGTESGRMRYVVPMVLLALLIPVLVIVAMRQWNKLRYGGGKSGGKHR